MARIGGVSHSDHQECLVFIGGRQFAFDSVENAIEALDRSRIIKREEIASDILERREIRLCEELIETWPQHEAMRKKTSAFDKCGRVD